METNKYYTPTIEEFHADFECERLVNGIWEKYICAESNDRDYGNGIITLPHEPELNVNYEKVRVKLLDKEDIKSLEWELDSVVEKEFFYIHKTSSLQNDIRLVFRQKENSIEINSSKFGECFYGIIKNKSELQKLMSQLNIK